MTKTSMTKTLPGFRHVDHIGLTVPDLNAAIAFYEKILGCRLAYRIGPFDAKELPLCADGRDWTEAHVDVAGAKLEIAVLTLGPTLMLELFEYSAPDDRRKEPPRNCDAGGHHLAFRVDELEPALAFLVENGCRKLDGPIAFDEGPTAGCRCQYVADPWGNYIELMEYEEMGYWADTDVRPFGNK